MHACPCISNIFSYVVCKNYSLSGIASLRLIYVHGTLMQEKGRYEERGRNSDRMGKIVEMVIQ